MTNKPLFTPTAVGTAYDIQPMGVLTLLASGIYENPAQHKNGRLLSCIDAMLTAPRAYASADHAALGRIFKSMHKETRP